MSRPRLSARAALLGLTLTMGGCDNLTGAADAAKLVAEGKATGSACRHSGRAIEDCYSLNPGASRAAIFSGWKEMNDYMRDNKIEDSKPLLPPTRMIIPDEDAPAPVKESGKEKDGGKDKEKPAAKH